MLKYNSRNGRSFVSKIEREDYNRNPRQTDGWFCVSSVKSFHRNSQTHLAHGEFNSKGKLDDRLVARVPNFIVRRI